VIRVNMLGIERPFDDVIELAKYMVGSGEFTKEQSDALVKADNLCRGAGGRLHSRQAIAAILVAVDAAHEVKPISEEPPKNSAQIDMVKNEAVIYFTGDWAKELEPYGGIMDKGVLELRLRDGNGILIEEGMGTNGRDGGESR